MSCETQLIQCTTDIANTLAADKHIDVLVMVLSRAFNEVGHGRLLHKFANYGGVLSGRTQDVVVGDSARTGFQEQQGYTTVPSMVHVCSSIT